MQILIVDRAPTYGNVTSTKTRCLLIFIPKETKQLSLACKLNYNNVELIIIIQKFWFAELGFSECSANFQLLSTYILRKVFKIKSPKLW